MYDPVIPLQEMPVLDEAFNSIRSGPLGEIEAIISSKKIYHQQIRDLAVLEGKLPISEALARYRRSI